MFLLKKRLSLKKIGYFYQQNKENDEVKFIKILKQIMDNGNLICDVYENKNNGLDQIKKKKNETIDGVSEKLIECWVTTINNVNFYEGVMDDNLVIQITLK